jgi:NTE family protein
MKKGQGPIVGVALSGGGVRALAQLGVLQVLEEAHIPVSVIAGTSMGGIIAGLYAAGVTLEELIAFSEKTGLMSLASPDPHWRGLLSQRRMAARLAELLGSEEVTFEELRIPAAVIAADLETGELVILDSGPLIPALLATSAFPVLFSPVRHQDRWLVDGGVLNNLPVDVVRQMGADRVLGVSVPPSVQLSLDEAKREKVLSLRGLRLFGEHTRDWKLPLLIAEASSGMTIQAINHRRLALCPPDVLLQVHLPNVGILSADNGNRTVIEAGRRAAMEHRAKLAALKRPLPPSWQRRWVAAARRLRRAWSALTEPEDPLYPAGPGRPRSGKLYP